MTDSASSEPKRLSGQWLDPAPWRAGVLGEQVKAGAFASARVQSWRDELARIRDDLTDILASHSVIEKLQDVIAHNPRLQDWHFFLERIFRWYATSTLVLVYRDVDKAKHTVGLRQQSRSYEGIGSRESWGKRDLNTATRSVTGPVLEHGRE